MLSQGIDLFYLSVLLLIVRFILIVFCVLVLLLSFIYSVVFLWLPFVRLKLSRVMHRFSGVFLKLSFVVLGDD